MSTSRQLGRLGRAWRVSLAANKTARLVSSSLAIRTSTSSFSSCQILMRPESKSAFAQSEKPDLSRDLFPDLDDFPRRHIGPDEPSVEAMLKALSPPAASLDEFVSQVIPSDILSSRPLAFGSKDSNKHAPGLSESSLSALGQWIAAQNNVDATSLIGTGYYGTKVPEVIKRNVLESPAWYTSYTPYQPEISQGRLEGLLNFQTLVSDLTALPISNASLLDEGTAAAEAMTLSLSALPSSRTKRAGKTYVVSHLMHPQTISVLRGRAEGFGIHVQVADLSDLSVVSSLGDDLVGVMVQYPDTHGRVHDYRALAEQVHAQGALLSCATDLLALALLTPPGEWGADVAFGTAQRLGVPMGFGGPHAAFFAVGEKHKRKMPGRLVGVSKDRLGGRALRLALQTREQHIRREKATSNVCTAQALLANMSALYAIYHGPAGLRAIAEKCRRGARVVQAMAERLGWETLGSSGDGKKVPFDTVVVVCPGEAAALCQSALNQGILVRPIGEDMVGISVDETTTEQTLESLAEALRASKKQSGGATEVVSSKELLKQLLKEEAEEGNASADEAAGSFFQRTSAYLTHPVFNSHHSETELLRYVHHLQSKDLSLVHSMIPLGSCTMKLNASAEMALITLPGLANMHPHTPSRFTAGYAHLVQSLKDQLQSITAMDAVSLQPNSGAQGEFAGLRVIREFHKRNGEESGNDGRRRQRDICLIPVSAHGTNPASAAMAGMRVVPIKCDAKTGNLDLADLRARCAQYADELAAIMITYPSTFGVFEPEVKAACEIVHAHGGQVYMDGANMNAQIGLCSPGEIGADVCHLNLHKTFCIPHGGGGPGVGPICVKAHLAPYLPTADVLAPEGHRLPVSSAPEGSASILPISWAYNSMMGGDGLTHATKITLLNANYLLSRLRPHYSVVYTNTHGRCAHEFILDARPFHATAGIEAIDIAKRLQDYGFHAPTMSWPVPNTLMIEPTESESQEELDRFVDALVSIRAEIRDVEEGRAPRDRNVLKMAPHPLSDIIGGDGDAGAKWDRPYSREQAAYPLHWLREKKFWPTVARVDDTYGDLNLFCTCPPVEDTTGGNLSSVQQD